MTTERGGGEDPDAEAQIKTILFIMQTELHFGNRATGGTLKASRNDFPDRTVCMEFAKKL
jgi:hypothetical protein